jgi:glutamyl-tRNA synthetase
VIATRFAPSPTGDLHIGGAWTALASWAFARAHGGRTVLRIEDIDPPRVVRGSAERVVGDLAWLGLDWDEGPIAQSTRTAIYERALAKLDAAGLTYPCDCSRAEIARIASAPHVGEEGPRYPGTCRTAPRDRAFKRPPAIRLRTSPGDIVVFDDAVRGRFEEDVAEAVGDFVLRRGDGVFAYQLVVAIDDAEMRISHVVRGDDLLASTARQLLLMRLLGYGETPTYAHVPLVVAGSGERLAKRTPGSIVRDLARAGVLPETIIGEMARGLGLVERIEGGLSARDVAHALRPMTSWRKTPWPLPSHI